MRGGQTTEVNAVMHEDASAIWQNPPSVPVTEVKDRNG